MEPADYGILHFLITATADVAVSHRPECKAGGLGEQRHCTRLEGSFFAMLPE